MKKVILGVFVVLLFGGCATMGPVADTSVVKIVEFDKAKDQAFDLSMRWLAETFKSAKSVIEYSDKAVGTINGKGIVSVPGELGIPVDVSFSLIVDVKDGKARLTFKAISVSFQMSGPATESALNPPIFESFKKRVDELSESYRKYLSSTSTDW